MLTSFKIDWASPTQLALVFGASGALHLVFLCLWRLLFHPLASFPGPWYLAVSELPLARNILRGRQFADYKHLHDKYGPVVRVAPNELSFNGGDAVDDIYGLRKSGQQMEKDPNWGLVGILKEPYGLQWAPREDHRRLRKALGILFTTSALLPHEIKIRCYVQQLLDTFKRMTDNKEEIVIDGQAWFGCLSFDVVASLCIGQTFGCLDSGDPEFLLSTIKSFATGGYTQAASRIVGHGNWAHRVLTYLITPRELVQIRTNIGGRAQAAILQRLADVEGSNHDFISQILRNNEEKGHISLDEIVINMLITIAAGGEAAGSALTEWAFAMGCNRDKYHKLVREIRDTFASAEDMNWHALNDLPYLHAVVRESFRWQGSVTQKIRIVPKGGAMIDGCWIPGGAAVALAPYAANHAEANFSDPYSFVPERWLNLGTKDKLYASMPFSHGPHDCIGKNLAFMELKLGIAHLIWHFDLDIESLEGRNWMWDPKNDFEHLRAVNTWQYPQLWIKLRKASGK